MFQLSIQKLISLYNNIVQRVQQGMDTSPTQSSQQCDRQIVFFFLEYYIFSLIGIASVVFDFIYLDQTFSSDVLQITAYVFTLTTIAIYLLLAVYLTYKQCNFDGYCWRVLLICFAAVIQMQICVESCIDNTQLYKKKLKRFDFEDQRKFVKFIVSAITLIFKDFPLMFVHGFNNTGLNNWSIVSTITFAAGLLMSFISIIRIAHFFCTVQNISEKDKKEAQKRQEMIIKCIPAVSAARINIDE